MVLYLSSKRLRDPGTMGQQAGVQERLFYEFRLDDWVPTDHLLRKIDGIVDSTRSYLRHAEQTTALGKFA